MYYSNGAVEEYGTFTYDDSSFTGIVTAFDYNGTWMDYDNGPWIWGDERRIRSHNYEFIDANTLYLFGGSSTMDFTLTRQ